MVQMENIVMTHLTVPEIRQLFRQELMAFFGNANPSAPAPDQDKPLTIKEAAELLTLAPPTIYAMVGRREIPHYKKGNRLYFSRADLTAWVKSGRKSTAAEIAETAIKSVGGNRGRV